MCVSHLLIPRANSEHSKKYTLANSLRDAPVIQLIATKPPLVKYGFVLRTGSSARHLVPQNGCNIRPEAGTIADGFDGHAPAVKHARVFAITHRGQHDQNRGFVRSSWFDPPFK